MLEQYLMYCIFSHKEESWWKQCNMKCEFCSVHWLLMMNLFCVYFFIWHLWLLLYIVTVETRIECVCVFLPSFFKYSMYLFGALCVCVCVCLCVCGSDSHSSTPFSTQQDSEKDIELTEDNVDAVELSLARELTGIEHHDNNEIHQALEEMNEVVS